MSTVWDSAEFLQTLAKARNLLNELATDPNRQSWKELYAMGIITPLLDEVGADPAVIVGGHAVEFYTSGSYKTADVDLVMIRDDLARKLFELLGFERTAGRRHYYIKELDIPIEIPSDTLAGSKDKIVKLSTPEGYCYVIGIEDLVLDRLKAALYWDDKRSEEWAIFLISAQMNQIDMDYIRTAAQQEDPDLFTKLEEVIQWISSQSE
ncbi:hypothetical protein [Paenibacillus fonticola]|uniref:hypothetical protein n=1 Tax=Paenibacillus fonticola TaxID=379896 RepID=UPI000363B81D|nr:hypothetical protein [Paenibacillus fonticola]